MLSLTGTNSKNICLSHILDQTCLKEVESKHVSLMMSVQVHLLVSLFSVLFASNERGCTHASPHFLSCIRVNTKSCQSQEARRTLFVNRRSTVPQVSIISSGTGIKVYWYRYRYSYRASACMQARVREWTRPHNMAERCSSV